MKIFCLFLIAIAISIPSIAQSETITIGSKADTEGYILSEILAQWIESQGFEVNRRLGLGQTGIVFEALQAGEIDLYPEYTGTLAAAILHQPDLRTHTEIAQALQKEDLLLGVPFGFNNTYALALPRALSKKLNIRTISQLAQYNRTNTGLSGGFTHEFMNRKDGLKSLKKFYNLKFPRELGMEHALTFEAIKNNKVDLIEV